VNGAVHSDNDPLDCGFIVKTNPTQECGNKMVEAMKESDLFLSHNEDVGINEFIELTQEKDIVPVIQVSIVLLTLGITDEGFPASFLINYEKLSQHSQNHNKRTKAQDYIMNNTKVKKIPCLLVFHPLVKNVNRDQISKTYSDRPRPVC